MLTKGPIFNSQPHKMRVKKNQYIFSPLFTALQQKQVLFTSWTKKTRQSRHGVEGQSQHCAHLVRSILADVAVPFVTSQMGKFHNGMLLRTSRFPVGVHQQLTDTGAGLAQSGRDLYDENFDASCTRAEGWTGSH